MQRSLSLNHSCAELSSYLILRGTKIVAVNCECACAHSSPASAPWFLNTLTYLNRASFFKSAMRDAHTHNTRSISSSLNCDIRLSCSGVSTTTSWAPSAPILSYIPSANRAGSPSTWYSGCGCGSTRTCHTPSPGRARPSHFVVHPFGQSCGFALNVVQRMRVRQHTHLPYPFRRPRQNGPQLLVLGRLPGAFLRRSARCFTLPQDEPALCDGIFAKFHSVSSAGVAGGCRPLFEAVTIPNRAFAREVRHFEILR